MTIPSLAWLAAASLVGLVLAPRDRLGSAVSRIVMAGFSLSALRLGADTLQPSDLANYVTLGSDNALFVSTTVGLLVGAFFPWPLNRWPHWIGGIPVVVVAGWVTLHEIVVLPFILGVVLGAVPGLIGHVIPRVQVKPSPTAGLSGRRFEGWVLLGGTTLLALVPWLSLALLVPLLVMAAVSRGASSDHPRRRLVLPGVAMVAALALAVVAIEASGDLLLRPERVLATPELMSSASRLTGLLSLVLILSLLSPWPLSRCGLGVSLAPAALILTHRLAWQLVPVGIDGWRPVVVLLLVPSVVLAAWRGRWSTALVTLAFISLLRPGSLAQFTAAIATLAALTASARQGRWSLVTGDRVTFPTERWTAGLATLAVVGAIATLLNDEVVLATLLAAGCAAAAARPALAETVS